MFLVRHREEQEARLKLKALQEFERAKAVKILKYQEVSVPPVTEEIPVKIDIIIDGEKVAEATSFTKKEDQSKRKHNKYWR